MTKVRDRSTRSVRGLLVTDLGRTARKRRGKKKAPLDSPRAMQGDRAKILGGDLDGGEGEWHDPELFRALRVGAWN